MLHRAYYVVLIICIAIGAASCSSDNTTTPPPPSENTIIIRDNFFDPPNISVSVGRTVVWRHQGAGQHTVTSGTPTTNPGTLFDSGVLNPGGGFTYIFGNRGTYTYFCRVHGINMAATVTVN